MKTDLEIVHDFGRYLAEDGKSSKAIESYEKTCKHILLNGDEQN